MTDVTGARHAGKTRPLGIVKDEPLYYDRSLRYPRSYYKNGGGLHREKGVQRDMKDNLRQATLINIVAAVNDTYNSDGTPKQSNVEPGSAVESLNNTMAVISNLMSPRDRSISIPTTQVVFQLPDTVVQRKPVYYKHSEDEEVKREHVHTFNNTGGYQMKVKTKHDELRKPPTPEKIVKIIPAKSPSLSANVDIQTWVKDPTKTVTSRSWSPVRRLGSVTRRSDSRKVREISKCDAIDILESTETLKLSQIDVSCAQNSGIAVHSVTSIDHADSNQNTQQAFYRTKSLPAMFPAKTTRMIRSVQSNRASTEIPKPRPASRGFGRTVTDSLTVVQGKNLTLPGRLTLDGTSISTGQDQSEQHAKAMVVRMPSRQRQRLHYRPVLSLRKLENATEISAQAQEQYCQRSTKYKHRNTHDITDQHFQKSHVPIQSKDNASMTLKPENRAASSDFNTHWRAHARPSSETTLSDVSAVIESRNSARSKKSCIAGKSETCEEYSNKKEPKRVQFAGKLEGTALLFKDDHTDFLNYEQNDVYQTSPEISQTENDDETLENVNQTTSDCYPAPQHAMVQELDRLKEKLIRTDIQNELRSQQSYNFAANNSGIQISGLLRAENDITSLNSDWDDRGSCSDVFGDDGAGSGDGNRTEADDKTQNACSTGNNIDNKDNDFDDNNIVDDDGEYSEKNSDNGNSVESSTSSNREEQIYKVIKAVDRDSYSGFEHKKIRKASGYSFTRTNSDHSKAHFVKVKMAEI